MLTGAGDKWSSSTNQGLSAVSKDIHHVHPCHDYVSMPAPPPPPHPTLLVNTKPDFKTDFANMLPRSDDTK